MMRGGRLLRSARAFAWILLLWFALPAPLALLESFQAPLPPGILDGDDDDDALTSLPDLDLKPLATIPSPPPNPEHVGKAAPVETDRSVTVLAPLPTPSRSPPIL